MNLRDLSIGDGNIKAQDLGISAVSMLSFLFLIVIPAGVYLMGAGIGWIALGMFIIFSLLWDMEGFRIMRYTARYKNVSTVSEFLHRRFRDDYHILQFISAIIITIPTFSILVFALHAGIRTFSIAFSIRPYMAGVILVAGSLIPCFVAGFKGIYKTCSIKGIIVLTCTILICIGVYWTLGTRKIFENIMQGWAAGNVSRYVNALYSGGVRMTVSTYASYLSYGLLMMGIPALLMFFMTTKSAGVINKSRKLTIIFMLIVTFSSCIMGGFARAMIYPESVQKTNATHIQFVNLLFNHLVDSDNVISIITGFIFIIAMLFCYTTLIELCIHVITVEIINDFMIDMVFSGRNKIKDHRAYRIVAGVVMFLALYFNLETEDKIGEFVFVMFLVMCCAVGPVVLMSVRWKRMNIYGAVTGLITPVIVLPALKYIRYIPGDINKLSFAQYFDINPILPAFAVNVLFIMIASLVTKKPSKEMLDEYREIKNRIIDKAGK